MAEIIGFKEQIPAGAEETAPLEKCRELTCFANENGYCSALGDTDFGMRRCPFFKTKEDALTDQLDALQRLVDKGRFDLIEKYRDTLEAMGILDGGDSFFHEYSADIDYMNRLRELEMQLKEETKGSQEGSTDSKDGLTELLADEWEEEDVCEDEHEVHNEDGCEDSCEENKEGDPDGHL